MRRARGDQRLEGGVILAASVAARAGLGIMIPEPADSTLSTQRARPRPHDLPTRASRWMRSDLIFSTMTLSENREELAALAVSAW